MTLEGHSKAVYFSMRSFLNSLLRDYSTCSNIIMTRREITITDGTRYLKVPIRFFSHVGFHEYDRKILEGDKEVSFKDLVNFVSFVLNADDSFIEKVENSKNNIYRNLNSINNSDKSNYLSSEQSLLIGHPFHPFPKFVGNISIEEYSDFVPESGIGFKLRWVNVRNTSLEILEYEEKVNLKKLIEFDLDVSEGVWIPMHPLQIKYLQKMNSTYDGVSFNDFAVATGKNDWFACSSMRTVYCESGPCYIKFSLPVKLTNSIRVLNSNDLKRSSVINEVFLSKKLERFYQKYPNFSIQLESSFGGVIAGEHLDNFTIFQLREPLKGSISNSFLLASLCEKREEGSRLREISLSYRETFSDEHVFYKVRDWFTEFLDNCVSPILELAFGEGILLGAHLQNLIIELKDGRPYRVEFRDCQGTGLTDYGAENFDDLSKLGALVIDSENTNKVFGYYLVVNTIFTVIASLTLNSNKEELILLNALRTYLIKQKKMLKNGADFFNYWINSKEVYQKGNFRCSIKSSDENTMSDPWSIYNKMNNPLTLLRSTRTYGFEKLYSKTNFRNGKTISLRKLDVKRDLEIFHEWHNKDFVSNFWEMNKSKNELKSYVEELYNSHYQLPLIVELDDFPIGYFELYWAFDDRIAPFCNPDIYDRGVHLLIGEEKVLKTRHVFDALNLISEFCFYDEEFTENVWGEPRADNLNVLKFAKALPGWEVLNEFSFPHKRARLLCCSRYRRSKEL